LSEVGARIAPSMSKSWYNVMMTSTAYAHVELDAKGRPCIDGTRTRVIDIAMDHVAYKWDAGQIQQQHPHLTLAQIHSALAYYYDHQGKLDKAIEERKRTSDEFFKQMGETPAHAKLKSL
jgi:uncharacterized protein (DUF433 family)